MQNARLSSVTLRIRRRFSAVFHLRPFVRKGGSSEQSNLSREPLYLSLKVLDLRPMIAHGRGQGVLMIPATHKAAYCGACQIRDAARTVFDAEPLQRGVFVRAEADTDRANAWNQNGHESLGMKKRECGFLDNFYRKDGREFIGSEPGAGFAIVGPIPGSTLLTHSNHSLAYGQCLGGCGPCLTSQIDRRSLLHRRLNLSDG